MWEDETVSAHTATEESVDTPRTETNYQTQECETLNDADRTIERLVSNIPKGVKRTITAYKIVRTVIFDEVCE